MSQDIRSYFIGGSKQSSEKNKLKNKPRKNACLVFSDDETSSDYKKNKNDEKKTNHVSKSRSKKRTISSDEDEIEIPSQMKSKKAKAGSTENSKHEKLIEINDISKEFLNKRPVKRVNAVQVNKRETKKINKISKLNKNDDFMGEDDDFDATLNQLDTSQIEDEYLSTINTKVSSFFSKSELESADDSNKNEKESPKNQRNKINKEEKVEFKPNYKLESKKIKEDIIIEASPSKRSKSNIDTKGNKSKVKQLKNVFHSKLEIEKSKKPKTTSIETSDIDNEIIKKKQMYQNYLNRGGARNPGSKEIPKGAEQCLVNLTFLITGVLDSLEKEEACELIEQYGGKVVKSVSKKINYIIVGDEAGPLKLAKAESLGIKQITEDDFLDLIRTRPSGLENKKLSNTAVDKDRSKKKDLSNIANSKSNIEKVNHKKSPSKNHIKNIEESTATKNLVLKNIFKTSEERKNSHLQIENNTPVFQTKGEGTTIKHNRTNLSEINLENKKDTLNSLSTKQKLINKATYESNYTAALVEKYRPKELKQIIGQNGDKSNAIKLQYWLSNWYKNHGKNSKTSKPKFSSRDNTGTIYKAALLSGPPGIGKTTTAYVVCEQLGYEILEFNASDTRSKRLLQDEIASILSNRTVTSFLSNTGNKKDTSAKHVLLMDEVDGMAGNEDRGGMQELIAFIKSTEVPIICICNDRNSQKIRTLANYTFDLRFQRPKLVQIRAAMMSLCFKEGIKITPEELTLIIESTNQDIRQIINHLSVLSAKVKSESKNNGNIKYKSLRLGPWDVVRKVFSSEEHKSMTIHDKSDLFFHDYNIAALFVQENYPIVTPSGPKNQLHEKLANCSESLAIGDVIENNIRVNQCWNLLPIQACFSSVIPGTAMSGFLNSQINFPSWLGKNSKSAKCNRLLQDITVHARITTGASKEAINLDYLKLLVDSIIRPMVTDGTEGVKKSVSVMNTYHLSREDLDSLIELTKWPHTRDPMQFIDTKTKTAFTKAYNKSASYTSVSTMKKKHVYDPQSEGLIDSEEEVIDDDDDDKIENDKLIKAKKC